MARFQAPMLLVRDRSCLGTVGQKANSIMPDNLVGHGFTAFALLLLDNLSADMQVGQVMVVKHCLRPPCLSSGKKQYHERTSCLSCRGGGGTYSGPHSSCAVQPPQGLCHSCTECMGQGIRSIHWRTQVTHTPPLGKGAPSEELQG